MKIKGSIIRNSVVLIVLYIICGYIGRLLAIPPGVVSPLWPPSGIALAAILWLGYQYLPSIFIASLLFNLLVLPHYSIIGFISAMMIGFGAMLQAYAGAWAIQHFTKTSYPFNKVTHVITFILVSFLSCSINALIGTLTLYLFSTIPSTVFLRTLTNWWLGDSVGVLTVTSTLLAIKEQKFAFLKLNKLELLSLIIILFGTASIIYILNYPLAFLLIPISIWATFRFNLEVTCIVGLFIAAIITVGAVNGRGEFSVSNLNETILFVQGFVSIVFILSLILYALQFERAVANDELRLINLELEDRVAKKTQSLSEKNQELEIAMTKLKQAQSQLVQSEKMSSLGVLTAGIAHEINNPINFVSANIQPLLQDVNDIIELINKYKKIAESNESSPLMKEIKDFEEEIDLDYVLNEITELINGIQSGATRTADIVKNLRVFSRLDEGEAKLADLHQNIDSTLAILHNEYKNRITINKHYGNIPKIECYPGKLNQVFMNVLLNSIQSIEDKGEIDITTAKIDDSVSITISDTGSGIKKEDLSRIFEPFYTTKTVGKGMGLGLSISYSVIVEDHGGTITYESEPGKGTKCVIILPISHVVPVKSEDS